MLAQKPLKEHKNKQPKNKQVAYDSPVFYAMTQMFQISRLVGELGVPGFVFLLRSQPNGSLPTNQQNPQEPVQVWHFPF